MTRLIDADALKHSLNITGDETSCIGCSHLSARGCYEQISYVDVCTAIDEQPTVDHVKHGKWIDRTIKVSAELTNIIHICSVCEEMAVGKYRYCPHCGARMDKDE